MSDSNRTAVALVKETTPGTTPATPKFKKLRITGATLTSSTRTVTSAELRADRQIADLTKVGIEAGGQVPFELSHAAQEELFAGAMFNAWTARYPLYLNADAALTELTGIDGATDTLTYNDDGRGAFVAKDLVRLSGFANAQNNGIFEAQATTAAGSLVLPDGRVTEVPGATARAKKVGVVATAAGVAATATGLTGIPAGLGLVKGDWIKIGGPETLPASRFANAGNNGFARISNVSGTTLTFDIFPAGWAADPGTGKSIHLYVGEYIRNGVTARSYTVEEQFQDLAVPEYHYFRGMQVGQLQLTSQAQQLLTGSVTFMGMDTDEDPKTARLAGAADVAAPAFEVLSASSTAGALYEGGTLVAGPNFVLGSEITIDNTLRRRLAQGTPGATSIGAGRFNVTGRLNTYYGDKTLLKKQRSNQATGYTARFGNGDDTVGKESLILDLPRIKFSGGDPTVQGVDTDRMIDLTFQGTAHPTLGYTMQIQIFEGYAG